MNTNEQKTETGNNEFRHLCIVEIFGHTQIAGMVSSQEIGGETFVRVDVPDVGNRQGYTKFYGKNAIYSITPTGLKEVMLFLANCYNPPVSPFLLEEPKPDDLGGEVDDDLPFEESDRNWVDGE